MVGNVILRYFIKEEEKSVEEEKRITKEKLKEEIERGIKLEIIKEGLEVWNKEEREISYIKKVGEKLNKRVEIEQKGNQVEIKINKKEGIQIELKKNANRKNKKWNNRRAEYKSTEVK
jgi:hypothetical protein